MQPDWIWCLTAWNSTTVKHSLKQVFPSMEKNGWSVFPFNLLLKVKHFLWGPPLTCRVDFSDIPAKGQKILTHGETGAADLAESLTAIHSVEHAWGKKIEQNQVPSVCLLVCTKHLNLLPMWADRERHIKPNRTKVSDCSTLICSRPGLSFICSDFLWQCQQSAGPSVFQLKSGKWMKAWVTSGVNKADCVMFPNICLVWAKHT